jgi:hypothetical protein
VYRDFRIQVFLIDEQCARCDTLLVRLGSEPAMCRACLRELDADPALKKEILFPSADPAEALSAFA